MDLLMPQHNNFQVSTHLIIGVTGHRNLHLDEIADLREKIRRFFLELQLRYPELPLCLLSPLATGSDQLVTDVALAMGIQVIAPLPMDLEHYLEDFDTNESREKFNAQCRQAKLLTLPLYRDSLLESIKIPGPERDLQYAQAGIFVSNHCHILLALWDGKESDLLGGTAQVVKFHLHGTMPGPIDSHRAALGLFGMDDDTLVHHIYANRQDQERVAIKEQNRWLTSNPDISNQAVMPEAFDLMFRRQAAFNTDKRKFLNTDAQQTDTNTDNTECPIHSLFCIADGLASLYQKRVRLVLKITFLLTALMGFAFVLYSDQYVRGEILYLFFTIFLVVLGVVSIAKRREWHRKYIDYRVLAEGLRVQSYWRCAGIVDNNTPSFVHENYLHHQDNELVWIRNIMRAVSIDGILKPNDNTKPQVKMVIDDWIGDPEHSGQLRYYSKTSENRTRLRNHYEMLGHASLWAGIAISVVLVIFAQLLQDDLQNIMIASMGVLSVAAAIHEAYAYKKADKMLIKQYRFMQRIFTATKQRLITCDNVEEQRQLLRTLGEAALAEHAEWAMMNRKSL
jgi:hypothetical protein